MTEDAIVIQNLDMFLTVRVLKESSAVLFSKTTVVKNSVFLSQRMSNNCPRQPRMQEGPPTALGTPESQIFQHGFTAKVPDSPKTENILEEQSIVLRSQRSDTKGMNIVQNWRYYLCMIQDH